MANQTLASLAITMRANAAQLVQEVQTARQSLAGLGDMMKGLAGASSAAVTAIGAVAISQSKAIKETKLWADQLGISTQRLTELSAVFQQNANIDGEQFNDMLQELNAKLGEAALTGGGTLVEAFEAIGLKFEEVRKLKTDEMLLQIADAFKVMEDQQALTFAAAEIFSGEAEKIVEVLKNGRGPIQGWAEDIRALNGTISDEEARDAAALATGVEKIETAFSGLAKELTIFLSGPGADAANWLSETIKNIRQADDVMALNKATKRINELNDELEKNRKLVEKFSDRGDDKAGTYEKIVTGATKRIREIQDELGKLTQSSQQMLRTTTTAEQEAAEKSQEAAREAAQEKIRLAQEEAAAKKKIEEDAEARRAAAAAKEAEMRLAFGGDPESIFESIQEQYSTELQLLNKHLEDKQELMKKFAKYNIGTEAERAALVNKIAKKHADDTFKLQAKEDAKLKAHKDKFMGHMLSANVKGSKAMLSVQKAFRVAEAVMEGKSAVMSAYKWGNSVGGPVVGAAFAATAAAFSAQQVASIISGGESSATSAATGAASAPDVTTPGLEDVAAANDEPQTTKTITVAFEGEGELVPRSVLRELAEELNSLDDSNVRISI